MNKKFSHARKSPAQAMVEFALVLPILLLVVYGLLEVGRLIFIYSSVVSAARQASRYGSTTGLITLGGVPRYQDCSGMRDAAQKVGFIDRIEEADIEIWHDEGEGVNQTTYCAPGSANDTSFQASGANNNRVRVRVSTQYTPIVPLVPLEPFTISSISARTILVSVPVVITAAPQGWDPNAPTIPPDTATPTITFTPSTTPTASATGTVTDTPTMTVSPTITLTPSKTSIPTITFTPSQTGTATSTGTATATSFACDVRHSELKTSPFGMTVFNYSAGVTIHITQIQIYWNPTSPAGQFLSRVDFGGLTIWTGNTTDTPLIITSFNADVSVLAGTNKQVYADYFDKMYKTNGSERILITFAESTCDQLDSANTNQLP